MPAWTALQRASRVTTTQPSAATTAAEFQQALVERLDDVVEHRAERGDRGLDEIELFRCHRTTIVPTSALWIEHRMLNRQIADGNGRHRRGRRRRGAYAIAAAGARG